MTDDFFLKFDLPNSLCSFSYEDQFLFIGSCFAENIGKEMESLQFKVQQNPNGILYHPESILDCLQRIIRKDYYTSADLVHREGSVHSWRHHGLVYAANETDFLDKANRKLDLFNAYLKSSDCLVITFGTAHYWYHLEKKISVANCHKQPSALFEKRLSNVEEIKQSYKDLILELRTFNPTLQIIISVSPVRYKRDGLIESNRSKARLLLLSEFLSETFEEVHYFPAYELLIDQLRDYRFYGADRVHPSEEAIKWIWKKFLGLHFSERTSLLVKKVEAVNKSIAHRFLFPESEAAEKFRKDLQKKIDLLKKDISHFEPRPQESFDH